MQLLLRIIRKMCSPDPTPSTHNNWKNENKIGLACKMFFLNTSGHWKSSAFSGRSGLGPVRSPVCGRPVGPWYERSNCTNYYSCIHISIMVLKTNQQHSMYTSGWRSIIKNWGHSPVIEEPFVVPTTWLTETYIKSGGPIQKWGKHLGGLSRMSCFRNHSNDDQFWLFQFFGGRALLSCFCDVTSTFGYFLAWKPAILELPAG